jgi:flagellar basal-body rod protein FlgC
MSMFRIFDVSGSAVSAQAQRLNVVASNLANADTVAGPDGQAYKSRNVVFQTTLMGARTGAFGGMAGVGGGFGGGFGGGLPGSGDPASAGVTVSTIIEDNTPGRRVHDPKHPQADAEGMVTYSNVNPIEEMVNMISASRSYQNNIEVMTTAKTLLQRTLQLGQS